MVKPEGHNVLIDPIAEDTGELIMSLGAVKGRVIAVGGLVEMLAVGDVALLPSDNYVKVGECMVVNENDVLGVLE